MQSELHTCVLVFVSQQRAALLEGLFTNITSIESLISFLQPLPSWPSVSLKAFINQSEVIQGATV